jgi:hypothetical protein
MIVTYLGHQGWSFRSKEGHVFLDPVFRTIGNAGVQLPVWPDREIDVARLGKIAGLVLSHEHSDHFDIETLYRMPWRGPVHISDRSSAAMRQLLLDLGYTVVRHAAFDVVRIADVEITFLPLAWSLLEPDAYGFLVRSEDGTSFFTGVDGMPHAQTVKWLETHQPSRTVDNFTNNYLESLPELTGRLGDEAFSVGAMTRNMIAGVEQLRPSRVVMSGQGWTYPPKYSDFNHRFFNVTHEVMVPIMKGIYSDIQWEAPLPGTRLALNGEVTADSAVDFVVGRKTTQRDYQGYSAALAGEPWSRRRCLGSDELWRVRDFIENDFGRLIESHGHRLMERLFALASHADNSVLPTLALRVLNGDGAFHYVLDQGWLRFTPAADSLDIRHGVAAGVEIWASDLLLLIEGREEPYLVYETAVRRWCNAGVLIGSTVHVHVFLAFGPRMDPDAYYLSYTDRLAEVRSREVPEDLDRLEGEKRPL